MVSTNPTDRATSPGVATPSRRRTWDRETGSVVVAVAATALALVLGLFQLGEPALDYDEAYTVGVVRGPFSDTWTRITNWDIVQAPYYLLMSVWYELGESEWLLRLPSVACFVASVPVVFALGRRLFDARVGAAAAVLFSLNGLALLWAQQARSYAMVLVLVSVSTYLLVWALDQARSTGRAVAYGVVAAVAVYAHFLVALVVAAHVVALLLRRPVPWRFLLTAGGIIGAASLPAVVWTLTLESDPLNWIQRPSLRFLVSMLADVAGGGRPQLFVVGSLVVLALVGWWSRSRGQLWSPQGWPYLLVLLCLALPVAVLIVSTYTVKPLVHPRYFVPVVPPFTLAAGAGLVWLVDQRRRLGLAVAAVVLVVAAQGAVSHFRTNDMHEWRTATRMVLDRAEPGDAVVVVPGQALQAVEYYLRRLDAADQVATLHPRAGDPPAGPTLWEVEELREFPLSYDPQPGYEDWRAEHYQLGDEQVASPRIVVRRYDLQG